MSDVLMHSVQRSIVLYVIKCEDKKYTGNHQFDLRYIKNSRYIPNHRKIDIQKLNSFITRPGNNDDSDADLAFEIFSYLKNIQTGVMFLWLFQIGNSSKLRDLIYNSIYLHDPDLYLACKNDSVSEYKARRNDNTDVCITIAGEENSTENALDVYVKLRNDNIDLKNKLNIETEKNATLSDTLIRQSSVNDGLKKKIDRILQKNDTPGSQVEIQMTNIGTPVKNCSASVSPPNVANVPRPALAVR